MQQPLVFSCYDAEKVGIEQDTRLSHRLHELHEKPHFRAFTKRHMFLLLPAGMASAAVKDRLDRIGQGVLKPSAGLAALAAVLRSVSGMTSLAAPSSGLVQGASAAVVTVNPFKWSTYLKHMQVRTVSHNCCLP